MVHPSGSPINGVNAGELEHGQEHEVKTEDAVVGHGSLAKGPEEAKMYRSPDDNSFEEAAVSKLCFTK